MVTVFRAHGLRFVIFPQDHEPAHVHVYGDGEMKVNLKGSNGCPEILTIDGLKHGDVRRAMQEIEDRIEILMAKWSEFHG